MNITEAQIKQWKEKFGEVFQIETPLDDKKKEVAISFYKKPNLKIISMASQFAEKDPIKVGEIIYQNCLLGGDKETLDSNDEARLSVIRELGQLFKVRTSTIKKL